MNGKEFKALAKQISFPGGKDTRFYEDSVTWSKRGGHAGSKTISKVVAQAILEGFTRREHDDSSSPDGSVVGSGTTYTKKVGDVTVVLSVSSRFGVTASENFFGASLEIE